MNAGQQVACWVRMDRAYAEMNAGSITDTRPGAASGVRPPKELAPLIESAAEIERVPVAEAPGAVDPPGAEP